MADDDSALTVAEPDAVSEPYSSRSRTNPPPLEQLLAEGAEDAGREKEYIVARSAEYWEYWCRQAERIWVMIHIYRLRGRGKKGSNTLEAHAKRIGVRYLVACEVFRLHDRTIRERIERNIANDIAEKGETFKHPTWRSALDRALGRKPKATVSSAEVIEELQIKVEAAEVERDELLQQIEDMKEGSPQYAEMEADLDTLRAENDMLRLEIAQLREQLFDATSEEVTRLRAEVEHLTAELAQAKSRPKTDTGPSPERPSDPNSELFTIWEWNSKLRAQNEELRAQLTKIGTQMIQGSGPQTGETQNRGRGRPRIHPVQEDRQKRAYHRKGKTDLNTAEATRDDYIQAIAAFVHSRFDAVNIRPKDDALYIDSYDDNRVLLIMGVLKSHPEIAGQEWRLNLLKRHEGRFLTNEDTDQQHEPTVRNLNWSTELTTAQAAEDARARLLTDLITLKGAAKVTGYSQRAVCVFANDDGQITLAAHGRKDDDWIYSVSDLEWVLKRKNVTAIRFTPQGCLLVVVGSPLGDVSYYLRGRPD